MALIYRLFRFGAVGAAITIFNYILFIFLTDRGVHYLIAVTLGWAIGVAVSYGGNKYLTFGNGGAPNKREISGFISLYVAQLILGSTTLAIMIDGLHLDYTIAYVLNVVITASFSFLLMDRMVFKASSPKV